MRQARWLTLVGSLVIALLTGCGSNVSVSSGGGGTGTGGEGGSGATTTGTSSTTSTIMPETYCSNICDQAKAAGCVPSDQVPECVESCAADFAEFPDCGSQFVAFYDCVVETFATAGCGDDNLCPAEQDALNECAGLAGCGEGSCEMSSDFCFCDTVCNGDHFGVECLGDAAGYDCECSIGGMTVGTCTQESLTCSPTDSCCTQYFSL